MSNTNQPIFAGLPQAVQNQQMPKEGPKAIPINVDFTQGQAITIDLSQSMIQSKISLVQSLYVDNSLNSVAVSFQVTGTNQIVTCPPNSQGFFPILAGIPTKILATSTSTTALVPCFVLNMPMPAAVWNVQQSAFTFIGGALEVTDVALDAIATANGLLVNPKLLGTNGYIPEFGGDLTFTGSVAATGPTNIIAAPGAGLAWYLKNLRLDITGDAAISGGAAELTVTIKDGTTAIFTAIVNVPATSGTGPGQNIFSMDDLNLPSSTLNNALTITLSAALTTGKIVWNAVGGTSTIVG